MEMENVAGHAEFRNEESKVETIIALEDWHGDRQLDVGRRGQPKKKDQGRWWVPDEVGRRPQAEETPCRFCTV
jgi:hypothetical protein